MTPLLGVGACVSIQFGVVEAVKRQFVEVNQRIGHKDDLTSWQLYQAGAAAGIANSFVAGKSILLSVPREDLGVDFSSFDFDRSSRTNPYSITNAKEGHFFRSFRLCSKVRFVFPLQI